MWHSSRLLKFDYFMKGSSILARRKILNLPVEASVMPNLVPTPLQKQAKILLATPPRPPTDESKGKREIKDEIEYTVKFKEMDVKKIFKEFYSLYGPLFVVCHISIALCSLGFFSTVVWLTVDPIQYLPETITNLIGQTMLSMTGSGGKFAIAYAIHKLILPFRLGAAIWVTRNLARKFKLKRAQPITKTGE